MECLKTFTKIDRLCSFLLSVVLALCIVPLASLNVSCSLHSEGASLPTLLDHADEAMNSGDTKEALTYLKKAQKQAHSTYERLGVYKRYRKLGEDAKCEQVLKAANKKIKNSPEIQTVYSDFLLSKGKVKDALKMSRNLNGTRYGSLYAEAFMRNALESDKSADELFTGKKKKLRKGEKSAQNDRSEIFYDRRFIPVYQEAARNASRGIWGINAACLSMMYGDVDRASAIFHTNITSLRESLFWGTVYYDTGRYAQSLEVLTEGNSFKGGTSDLVLQKALLADDYYILGEETESEIARQEVLALLEQNQVNVSRQVNELLPSLYVNSAQYSKKMGDRAGQYHALAQVVNRYPEYVQGLAAYADYALGCTEAPVDDKMTASIRAAGLRTRLMEAQEAVPFVSVQEVFERIKTAERNNSDPALIVLEEKLYSRTHQTDEAAVKASRVWPLLEKNEIQPGVYPQEIVRYVLGVLIHNGEMDSARTLFNSYLQKQYGSPENPDVVPSNMGDRLLVWEAEFAAWFYVQDLRISEAAGLYKSVVDRWGTRNPVFNASGQNEAVVDCCLNLANVYAGSGQPRLALDCLNRASERAVDAGIKAEALYRMGKQNYYLRDYQTASRTLQYALKLNPSHNKARLMLQKVNLAE